MSFYKFSDGVDHISGCMLSPSNFLSVGRKEKIPLPPVKELVLDVDGVEYRMALNGLFEGYLVGTRRTVITLD